MAADIPENPTDEGDLKRALGPLHLISLGIGCIIGAGIFVLTGHAAAGYAGPGVVISFAIAGLGCLFAGLCYTEYASMIPVAGSAYTYTYATMGRMMAWIIGWNLVLEYLAAASTVAVGWSGYFNNFLHPRGLADPCGHRFCAAGMAMASTDMTTTGTIINLPAVVLVGFITAVLIIGRQDIGQFQQCDGGDQAHHRAAGDLRLLLPHRARQPHALHSAQYRRGRPFRLDGRVPRHRRDLLCLYRFRRRQRGGAGGEESAARHSLGMLGSLLICTMLYMLMSYVLTGIAPYHDAECAPSGERGGGSICPARRGWRLIVNIGAIVGLASVVLVLLLAQSRVFYAMSRDGLVPKTFSDIHPRFRTPSKGNDRHRHLRRNSGGRAAASTSWANW